jgi:hypothetical protein
VAWRIASGWLTLASNEFLSPSILKAPIQVICMVLTVCGN